MTDDLSRFRPTDAQLLESLAKTVHEGDWSARASDRTEWRFDRAQRHEVQTAYRCAGALLKAHAAGAAESREEIKALIGEAFTLSGPGAEGRLRMKTEKVETWFALRAKGFLL